MMFLLRLVAVFSSVAVSQELFLSRRDTSVDKHADKGAIGLFAQLEASSPLVTNETDFDVAGHLFKGASGQTDGTGFDEGTHRYLVETWSKGLESPYIYGGAASLCLVCSFCTFRRWLVLLFKDAVQTEEPRHDGNQQDAEPVSEEP